MFKRRINPIQESKIYNTRSSGGRIITCSCNHVIGQIQLLMITSLGIIDVAYLYCVLLHECKSVSLHHA